MTDLYRAETTAQRELGKWHLQFMYNQKYE